MRRSAEALRERAGGRPRRARRRRRAAARSRLGGARAAPDARPARRSCWRRARGRALPGRRRLALEGRRRAYGSSCRPLGEEETGRWSRPCSSAGRAARAALGLRGQRGNVLYVRELLLGALADGALRETRGLLAADATPAAEPVADRARRGAAGRARAEERAALELLALGEPLRLSEMVSSSAATRSPASRSAGLVRLDGRRRRCRAGSRTRSTATSCARPCRSCGRTRRASAWPSSSAARRRPLARRRAPHRALAARCGTADPRSSSAIEAVRRRHPRRRGRARRAARRARARGRRRCRGGAAARARPRHLQALRRGRGGARRARGRLHKPGTAIEYLEQRTMLQFWSLQQTDEPMELLTRAESWWPDQAWQTRLEPLHLYFVWLVMARQRCSRRPRRCSPTPTSSRGCGASSRSCTPRTCSTGAGSKEACALARACAALSAVARRGRRGRLRHVLHHRRRGRRGHRRARRSGWSACSRRRAHRRPRGRRHRGPQPRRAARLRGPLR